MSKMGGDFFGPKVVYVIITLVLSIMKFECLGDVRIWDGGVPKNIGEVVVQLGIVGSFMKDWVAEVDYLGKVLIVKKGSCESSFWMGPFHNFLLCI